MGEALIGILFLVVITILFLGPNILGFLERRRIEKHHYEVEMARVKSNKARTIEVRCPQCDGIGAIIYNNYECRGTCPTCAGSGIIEE